MHLLDVCYVTCISCLFVERRIKECRDTSKAGSARGVLRVCFRNSCLIQKNDSTQPGKNLSYRFNIPLVSALDEGVPGDGMMELVQDVTITSVPRRRQPKLVPPHERSPAAQSLRAARPSAVCPWVVESRAAMVHVHMSPDCRGRKNDRASVPPQLHDGVESDRVWTTLIVDAVVDKVER